MAEKHHAIHVLPNLHHFIFVEVVAAPTATEKAVSFQHDSLTRLALRVIINLGRFIIAVHYPVKKYG